MSLQTDNSADIAYPAPRSPMVGKYLVRKTRVAAGLRAIDLACTIFRGSSRMPPSGEPRAVLFSQCGHLGDLIMTLPTLRWVRQHRPEVRIGLIVGSWAKPMMQGISELYDASYIADHFMLDRSNKPLKEKIEKHRRSWKNAAREIRKDGYDAAVECYPFLQNSIPLLYATNIPVRVGFTSGGFGPLLTHRARWIHDSRPFLDYPRDVLRLLFSDASLQSQFKAFYPVPPGTGKKPKQPYVVIQTGTGNPIREWTDECWIQLVKELSARGMSPVLAGAGQRERQRAERIVSALSSPSLVDLCDKLSWDEFTDLVAGAAHVVCLESSTSHIAAAFNIASTVIMPAINDSKQFGPANDKANILTYKTPCAPCFRSAGCAHMSCIRRVTVDDAVGSVLGVRNI